MITDKSAFYKSAINVLQTGKFRVHNIISFSVNLHFLKILSS